MAKRAWRSDPTRPPFSLIRRAVDWRDRWFKEPSRNLAAIAKEDGVDPGDVSNHLRLAFLAPDIVKALLDGSAPAALKAERLRRLGDLPASWSVQRKLFGSQTSSPRRHLAAQLFNLSPQTPALKPDLIRPSVGRRIRPLETFGNFRANGRSWRSTHVSAPGKSARIAGFMAKHDWRSRSTRIMVEGGGFEPPYAEAGRFTVCWN